MNYPYVMVLVILAGSAATTPTFRVTSTFSLDSGTWIDAGKVLVVQRDVINQVLSAWTHCSKEGP